METFEVSKTFSFSYTHRLFQLEDGHQCRNFHGHTAKIFFKIEAERIDQFGFVTDFGNLKFIKRWIDENWDHAVIVPLTDSDLMEAVKILKCKAYYLRHTTYSTSENLCKEIYKSLIKEILSLLDRESIKLLSITIGFHESDTSYATYKRSYS